METQPKKSGKLVAVAIVGSIFTGLAGFLGAFFAFFRFDATGFGVSILASAFAFGFLVNALLRE